MIGFVPLACSITKTNQEKDDLGPCVLGQEFIAGVCYPGTIVAKLDSVGFLPGRVKVMTVAAPPSAVYNIRRIDGTIVQSNSTGASLDGDTQETDLQEGTFTSLVDPGDYFVEVRGVGISPPFHIGSDAYDGVFKTLMLGMYGWRCGTAVSFTSGGRTFNHGVCHTGDAWLDYAGGSHAQKDGKGGWHDAGDYGKYVINAGVSVGTMLTAWTHFKSSLQNVALAVPEHGGAIPDFLAEIKWELDWLLRMQFDGGGVSHKLTALNFEGFIMPEADLSTRYFTPIATPATAYLAAVMAMAARIYKPYDQAFSDRCSAAASSAYQYLQANPDAFEPDMSAFTTGGYNVVYVRKHSDGTTTVDATNERESRLWAAAELWETTGRPEVLADLETRIQARASRGLVEYNFDWGNTQTLGLFTYLASTRQGRDPDIVRMVGQSTLDAATSIRQNALTHAYGRALGSSYWWGSNGTIARTSMTFQMAYRLTGDPSYLDAAIRQIDHLLGRNYYGRSFVTGVGFMPPLHPHHRPSAASGQVWPGLLVGGPDQDAIGWKDMQSAYNLNEVCLNWNTALIYAVAGFLSDSQDGTLWLADGRIDAGLGVPDAGPDGAVDAALDAPPDGWFDAPPDVAEDADDDADVWAD
jgi:endoglucanase